MKALIFGAVAALMCGCASVKISSPGSLSGVDIVGATTPADRMVVVSNFGFHMFWTITLCSGDLRWDSAKRDIKGGTAFFSDYCGNDDCYEVLQRIAERENCDLVDVVFTECSPFGFSVTSYQGLTCGLCGRYDVQASAILRPRATAK